MPVATDSDAGKAGHIGCVTYVAGSSIDAGESEGASALLTRAGPADSRLKRALDIMGAVAALIVTSPILLIATLATRCTSRGPVLFIQRRIGLNGQPYSLRKLRTMVVDNDERQHAEYMEALVDGRADPHGQLFKLTDDQRRTRLGRVLRSWSVDELPQLVNVIRGEMSLVGPRPSTPEEVALWDDRSHARLRVRPGLTGLWQVNGRSLLTHLEMVELDLEYVESWSHTLDASILLRTPFAIVRRETA
jgi:lipopolysaccharide/colanic/teichoic acid biosynthesis glycosyltransferase